MFRLPVISSVLASVGYDPDNATLELEFQSGWVYAYFNIPPATHKALMSSESKGHYFCRFIRGEGYMERVE